MRPDILYIVTPMSNPLGWESRTRLARAAVLDWLKEPNVVIYVPECAYGQRAHELRDLADNPRVVHVPLRARTMTWNKENLINLAISRLPPEAKYIGTFDADIHWRRPGWASRIIEALDLHPVVQPWSTCHDLGPNDELVAVHHSFCKLYAEGKPVLPAGRPWWRADGGPYDYAHSGFAWAWTRDILDGLGGLFELGGMGSGDYHMATGLVGGSHTSIPGGAVESYRQAVFEWQRRALVSVNKKLGHLPDTIEHDFHGLKRNRFYVPRWDMFVKHQFHPYLDLKRNTGGVLEWSGNKPDLEREWAGYLRSRREDTNTLD